jgi:hypothetical protein
VIVLVLGVAALVVAASGAAWALLLRDTAAPASLEDALARYRALAAQGATAIPAGVYVYRTAGQESVSALGGTTHRYPRRSTITVTKAPCGMSLRWDVLETRSTTTTVCVTGERAQTLAGWVERHVFFGQADDTTWRCSGSPWLADTSAIGTRTRLACDGGDSKQTGVVEVLGRVPMRVGRASVETLHVRVTATEDGAARGPLVEERWVELETGLPVRLRYRVHTDNDSPIGDVAFDERYDLRLLSLVPRR